MQLPLQQLNQHLKGALLPIYFVSGDVPLLRQEARDTIRQSSEKAGYQNYQRLEVESGFHWSQLLELANSYSLFADKTLIEVHNPEAKFDAEAGKILQNYCENVPDDKILLIISGKLSSAQQKTRWYKSITERGANIPVWPIKSSELPKWIQNRLKQAGMTADAVSIHLLAEYTEGNLLATHQAIIKLRLLFPSKNIGISEMQSVISENAQFNVFELSQVLLQGDCRNVLRILYYLRANDVEPTLVLWLLAKECRGLLQMATALQQGKAIHNLLANQWPALKTGYQAALQRLNADKLAKLLLACHQTDKIIKGAAAGDVWNALTQISLAIAGQSVIRSPLPCGPSSVC